MCKEKHCKWGCGCTEFLKVEYCPSLFKSCRGPRGEEDRIYEDSPKACDLCQRNGWRPSDDGKEPEPVPVPVSNYDADKRQTPDGKEERAPTSGKRKRVHFEED